MIMLSKSNNTVTWHCDNCDDVIPVGSEAYRMPDGTVLCSEVCVDDYAFIHADDVTKADSDVLAETWDKVETFVIPREADVMQVAYVNNNTKLTNKGAKVIHDYTYQGDVTAYICGALYAYQLLAKTHNDIQSDPTRKEWEQLMNRANRYADEDVVDDLEYWKLLIDGQQDD